MTLAIFDLDNTLLRGDSDYEWGRFLVEIGAVDADLAAREHDRYYAEYLAGTLDIMEFLAFQLRPLAEHDLPTLEAWRREFMRSHIAPLITGPAVLTTTILLRALVTMVVCWCIGRVVGAVAQRTLDEHIEQHRQQPKYLPIGTYGCPFCPA